ncbi:MAG: M28 family peptidase [Gemmatimonadota bacterium]
MSMRVASLILSVFLVANSTLSAQSADARLKTIARQISAQRIERDLRTIVGFGTRHTLSDTLSATRGIGAARRWVKSEFDRIASSCGGCLEVRYQPRVWKADGNRLVRDVNIVNVLAIFRGSSEPGRVVFMTAHLDSRASNANDTLTDAPGAADDGSGVAAVIETARVLASAAPFHKTVILAALSGEEQGLYGGQQLAQMARDSGWIVEGVLNNDIIGNARGMTGEANTHTFRVFSEPVPVDETDQQRRARRASGGEIDGPSRQLARYVDRITARYVPGADAVMIYRLDRFGRGGDHRAFNDLGFPAVRFTVMNEDYNRQHQDVRTENGISYGDVIEEISFPYIARVASANATSLASLAWAPPPPDSVRIKGAVTPSTTFTWNAPSSPSLAGYRIYWRETTEPQWRYHADVGLANSFTLTNVNIDNYFFGVASLGRDGTESVVVFAH